MSVAFDTSVLVAASVSQHAHRSRALPWLKAARSRSFDGRACVHAFAETFATLTALPIDPRIPPASARRLVERFATFLTPVTLAWGDYQEALERCVDREVRSGGVYDALHLIAAERTGAEVFLTFNTAHFTRLVGPKSPRIVAPPDPPAVM